MYRWRFLENFSIEELHETVKKMSIENAQLHRALDKLSSVDEDLDELVYDTLIEVGYYPTMSFEELMAEDSYNEDISMQ